MPYLLHEFKQYYNLHFACLKHDAFKNIQLLSEKPFLTISLAIFAFLC